MLGIAMNDSSTNASIPAPDLDLLWQPKNLVQSENIFRAKLAELKDSGKDDREFRIELLAQIARAEAAQGKFPEAISGLEEAKRLLDETAPNVPISAQIRILLEEGRILTLQRTPSQARTRFAKAWELAVSSGQDYFVVEIARAMAEIESLKLQEVWIRKAIEVAEKSTQEKARFWLGELYVELGWKLFDLRQFDASLAAHRSSLANNQSRGSRAEILQAKWAIGRLLRQLRQLPEALAWNEGLLFEIPHSGLLYGRLCEEIAECLLNLKRLEAAEPYFARAYHALSQDSVEDRHPLGLKRLKQLGQVA